MLKTTVKALQSDIEFVEKQVVNNNEAVQCIGLNKKRQELSSLLHEQAKGALIRSRYCSIKYMDAPSTFFFNLERKHVQQKMMCHLRRSDGSVTSDPTELRRLAGDFINNYIELSVVTWTVLRTYLKSYLSLEKNKKKFWMI